MPTVSKIKAGATEKLAAPYYLGAKTPTRQGGKLNSHYVMINPLVAARLGVTARSTHKPTDEFVGGAVFDKNRTYTAAGGTKAKTTAKRNITRGSKAVELYTGNYVTNPKTKKLEQEKYSVGFPSSLTMVDIIFYVNKQFPLVKFLAHGGRRYTSRKIEIPKGEKLEAEKAVAGK
jgi:hypothetical protein